MDRMKPGEQINSIMASIPSRLYRAMPAVLLGILLNTLDAGESPLCPAVARF